MSDTEHDRAPAITDVASDAEAVEGAYDKSTFDFEKLVATLDEPVRLRLQELFRQAHGLNAKTLDLLVQLEEQMMRSERNNAELTERLKALEGKIPKKTLTKPAKKIPEIPMQPPSPPAVPAVPVAPAVPVTQPEQTPARNGHEKRSPTEANGDGREDVKRRIEEIKRKLGLS